MRDHDTHLLPETIVELADEALEGSARADAQRHLAVCRDCWLEVAGLKLAALTDAGAPDEGTVRDRPRARSTVESLPFRWFGPGGAGVTTVAPAHFSGAETYRSEHEVPGAGLSLRVELHGPYADLHLRFAAARSALWTGVSVEDQDGQRTEFRAPSLLDFESHEVSCRLPLPRLGAGDIAVVTLELDGGRVIEMPLGYSSGGAP